jgi:hypothetical protein
LGRFIWARPLDQAKGAINAHSMEYVAFAEAGERETGKKGVVLVEAGRPWRYLTAEDLSAVPEQTHGALQKMIQKLDQKEFLDQVNRPPTGNHPRPHDNDKPITSPLDHCWPLFLVSRSSLWISTREEPSFFKSSASPLPMGL